MWERGETTVSIAFGYWAEHSFGGEAGQRCRITIGDANVLVTVSLRTIVAWYDRGSSSYEPVVAVSSTSDAELATLAPVVLSLRRREVLNAQ